MYDVSKTKASKRKMRVRWDNKHRWYVAHFHNSHYSSIGDTIEEAFKSHTRLCNQLT